MYMAGKWRTRMSESGHSCRLIWFSLPWLSIVLWQCEYKCREINKGSVNDDNEWREKIPYKLCHSLYLCKFSSNINTHCITCHDWVTRRYFYWNIKITQPHLFSYFLRLVSQFLLTLTLYPHIGPPSQRPSSYTDNRLVHSPIPLVVIDIRLASSGPTFAIKTHRKEISQ